MSTGAFEGLSVGLPPAERESYAPGMPDEVGIIAERLVGAFMDWYPCFQHSSTEMWNALHSYSILDDEFTRLHQRAEGFAPLVEGIDANDLLDRVLFLLMETDANYQKGCDLLLSPIVQALYSRGSNTFFVDLSRLKAAPERIGEYLIGDPGRPLEMSIHGEAGRYCQQARYVDVSVTGGNAACIGWYARHSVFKGITDGNAGGMAEGCEFSISSEHCLPSVFPSGCTYYLDGGLSERNKEWLWLNGFFRERGDDAHLKPNAIFVLGGPGSWTEVRL